MSQPQQTAAQAFDAKFAQANETIATIRTQMAQLATKSAEQPANWGLVANMTSLCMRLEVALESITAATASAPTREEYEASKAKPRSLRERMEANNDNFSEFGQKIR